MTAPRLGPGLWTARAMWGSIRPQPLPPSYTTTGYTNGPCDCKPNEAWDDAVKIYSTRSGSIYRLAAYES